MNLSFLPFFCKAAVEALKVYPQINSSIDIAKGTITYHDSENLGSPSIPIAVSWCR